ncbi:MAG: sensor domain-containing diguanylate cyclase [Pseudomonadota bacterium]
MPRFVQPPLLSSTPEAAPALPAEYTTALGQAVGSDTLLAVALLLALVGGLAVAAVVSSRREARVLARVARRRGKRLSELLRTVRMAESLAEVGVWQYDPATGTQHWSDGMRRLFGIQTDEPFVAGDAETVLYAHDIDLVGGTIAHGASLDPYSLRFEITGFDGNARTLSVEACNLRARDGSISRVVAVLRDVTEQKERERELEFSRAAAVREASRAQDLAETDALTGLANRRRVMKRLDAMIMAARKHGQPLVLVVFDIDHFKRVNDTYGHPEGDKVLEKIAKITVQQARERDLVGRIGGEEFVWVVPGADPTFAQAMTDRLRQAIALESATGPVPAVTISAGFAELRGDDTSLSLFARADEALYRAKQAGRNRVQMAA